MRFIHVAVLLAAMQSFSPQPWLDDFHQVIAEMSAIYANLDSTITDRRMDLPDLRRRTEDAIRNAKSDDEAERAIVSFLAAFGDGHLSVEHVAAPPMESKNETPQPLCARFGYKPIDLSGIDFARLPAFRAIEDADAKEFPGGILTLASKRQVGIVRIRYFNAQSHPELCSIAQKSLGLADDEECDNACPFRVDRAVSDLATAALERRVTALRAAGATAIVVDLTGNGGGSDWVEAAARVLNPLPLRSPRLGFIKHPHWSKDLSDRLADVEHDLANGVTPRESLLQAQATFRAAIAKTKETCDRSGVWLDEPKAPSCSLVVNDMLFATSLLPYAKPGSLPQGDATNLLFSPAQFAYHEGVNRLPLYVLVDSRTASASELFTAMMQDNKAATIIGTVTRGAGCGHTNGGIFPTLKNSGLRLSLPDCVRLRADGTNEIAGIIPDVLAPWSAFDSKYQRAAKTKQVLETVVK